MLDDEEQERIRAGVKKHGKVSVQELSPEQKQEVLDTGQESAILPS